MLLFVVFSGKLYIEHCSSSVSMLVLVNAVACTAFASFTSPSLQSDLGWYATVLLLMYTYFGGYVLVQHAYPVATLMTVMVALALIMVGNREDQVSTPPF